MFTSHLQIKVSKIGEEQELFIYIFLVEGLFNLKQAKEKIGETDKRIK